MISIESVTALVIGLSPTLVQLTRWAGRRLRGNTVIALAKLKSEESDKEWLRDRVLRLEGRVIALEDERMKLFGQLRERDIEIADLKSAMERKDATIAKMQKDIAHLEQVVQEYEKEKK